MNAQDSSAVATGMRKAAFWIGLRQEVTMAFASQRSIKISLSHPFIDQSFTDASDDVWANRIIVHCANVIEFCFGGSDQKASEYHALKEYDDGWLRSRPSSFLPLVYGPADPSSGNQFPQIVYMNHAVGESSATRIRHQGSGKSLTLSCQLSGSLTGSWHGPFSSATTQPCPN